MRRETRHRKPTGFTLIELLVVIAMIAIFAGILFPVFAQARDRGRMSACLSNMRQIGVAVTLYVQDYDETYPRTYLHSYSTATALPGIGTGRDVASTTDPAACPAP